MKKCPGCKARFVVRGGAIRIPTSPDEDPRGYHEFDICKKCAVEFQKIDRLQSKKDVQEQANE